MIIKHLLLGGLFLASFSSMPIYAASWIDGGPITNLGKKVVKLTPEQPGVFYTQKGNSGVVAFTCSIIIHSKWKNLNLSSGGNFWETAVAPESGKSYTWTLKNLSFKQGTINIWYPVLGASDADAEVICNGVYHPAKLSSR
ncbi:hypothetical protein BH10PSE19_BH10PSE19_22530 [soil metagenome]